MEAERRDDLALARRATDGDEPALEQVYAQHADALFAFIVHQLGGDRQDAEDVWQDTWLAAIRSLSAFRGESRLFSWMCAIARRKIADRWRGRQALREAGPDRLDACPDGGAPPDAGLAARERHLRVIDALGSLPGEYRQALVARYVREQSVEDVAASLGRSYKATESLLARARRALRLVLQEDSAGATGTAASAELGGKGDDAGG
jgi:RNA polymerase sigma-70 factor, ECF subfamily